MKNQTIVQKIIKEGKNKDIINLIRAYEGLDNYSENNYARREVFRLIDLLEV